MNFWKKALSGILALTMCAALAACHTGQDTTWIAKVGDTSVPAGVYLSMLVGQYQAVTAELKDEEGNPLKNPLKADVDGMTASQKISAEAQKELNEYLAIEQKFAELGATIPDEDAAQLDSMVEMYWSYIGSMYAKNGVSKDSYRLLMQNDSKKAAVFTKIYGPGGSEEVPETELKEKYDKDVAKVIMMSQDLSTDEDATAKEEANKKIRDSMDKYYKQLQADVSTMEEVYYQAKRETAEDPESVEKPEPGTSYTFTMRDDSSFEQPVSDAIFAAELGKPVTLETETAVYLFVRYDVNEKPEDFTTRKEVLTSILREDAFNEKVKGWGETVTVEKNQKALSRYTPESLDMSAPQQ